MRDAKENLRVIDTKDQEKKQAQKKLGYKVDFTGLEARDVFREKKVIMSTLKCTHDFNYYGF